MSTTLALIATVALWVTALARIPTAVHRPRTRPFTAAVAIFAVATTLRVPAVEDVVDRVGGSSFTDVLLATVLVVAGAAALREIVLMTTSGAESRAGSGSGAAAGTALRRHVDTAAVLLVLAGLAVFAPERPRSPSDAGPAPAAAVVWVIAYWGVYLTYLSVALARTAISATRAARAGGPRHRTLALALLAAGCGTGLLWVADQAALLVLTRLGLAPGFTSLAHPPLVAVAVVCVAAAGIIPLLADAPGRETRPPGPGRGDDLVALWSALAETTPSIVLDPGSGVPGPYRLTVEIRDGILAVRPFVTDDVVAAAAAVTGSEGDDDTNAAVRLDLARARMARGRAPGSRGVLGGRLDAVPDDAVLDDAVLDDAVAVRAFAAVWRRPRTRELAARAQEHVDSAESEVHSGSPPG